MSGLLRHSAGDIAAQALIDAGLGADPDPAAFDTAWPVYVDIEVDWPDRVICCKTNQGRSQGRSMITGVVERSLGVQIVVRSRLSNVGAQKAYAIQDFLEKSVQGMSVTVPEANGVLAGTYLINNFESIGDVIPVGLEAGSNRYVHTINPTMVVRMTSA